MQLAAALEQLGDDATQCYKIPVTGTVGYYRAVVTKLFKRLSLIHI